MSRKYFIRWYNSSKLIQLLLALYRYAFTVVSSLLSPLLIPVYFHFFSIFYLLSNRYTALMNCKAVVGVVWEWYSAKALLTVTTAKCGCTAMVSDTELRLLLVFLCPKTSLPPMSIMPYYMTWHHHITVGKRTMTLSERQLV